MKWYRSKETLQAVLKQKELFKLLEEERKSNND